MEFTSIVEELQQFKSLSADILHKLRGQAVERVHQQLGKSPQKEEYIRRAGMQPPDIITLETGWLNDIQRKAEPQDYLAALLALCFWVWSITHILMFGLYLANEGIMDTNESYQGIWVSHWFTTIVTQVVLVLISEIGVLYFFYRHMLVHIAKGHTKSPLRSMSANYVFAIFFAIFTIVANVWAMVSGIEDNAFWIVVGSAIGVILPFVNMYLGERFTELIAEVQHDREQRLATLFRERDAYYIRRTELLSQFDVDTREYWEAYEHPENYHKDDNNNYTVFLAEYIVDYYKRYNKVGKTYGWTPTIERAVAAREIAASRMGSSLLDEIEAMTTVFMQGS